MLLCVTLAACAGVIGPRQAPPPPPQEEPRAAAPAAPPAPAPAPDIVTPRGDDLVRIGLLLPLSGPRAGIGQAMLNAAQLALFDFDTQRLALLPRDTKGTAAGAAVAASQALDDGAQLLLGPVFADEVLGAAPPARARAVNMIAFSTDQRVAGDGVFLLSFLPEQEVFRIVSYARANGLQRIAALLPRTPYGERVAQAYRQAMLASGGGAHLQVVFYAPNAQDMHAPVKQLADYEARRQKLRAEMARLAASSDPFAQSALAQLKTRDTFGEVDFDALLIAEGGANLRALAPLLQYYDIDPGKVRLLGTGLWNASQTQAEAALNGGWFPAPPPDMAQNFAGRITKLYGNRPAPVEGLAYDAMALAAALAANRADPGQAVISQAALTNPNGFSGILGVFRLRQNGLAERGLAVMEITPAGAREIDAAPDQFN